VATIKFSSPHAIGKDRAKEAVMTVVEDIDGKLDVEYEWDGDTVTFERPGIEGFINVRPEEVEVEIRLGLIYRPFKSKIESRIRDYFEKLFV